MLIIQCPQCDTNYNYDESKFEGKPSKKIRCAKCKQVFEVFNPDAEGASAPASTPPVASQPAPASQDTDDETMVRKLRPEPRKEVTEETNAHSISSPAAMPENIRLSLAITEGPGSSQILRIERPSVTIGRTGADITIPDPESSRQHAQLEIRDGHYFLSDMGSRNGTWIEGQKIEGEVEISNQSEFRVGATTLMLIVTSVD